MHIKWKTQFQIPTIWYFEIGQIGELPGSPEVETLQGTQVWSLVRELGPHKPHGVVKKKKKKF